MYSFGMTDSAVMELPNDRCTLQQAWERINTVLTMPAITEQEVRALGVAEGTMYTQFRGRLNGVPSVGRLIKNREGLEFVVDFRYDTASLLRHQNLIAQKVGHLVLSQENDNVS